MFCQQCGHDIKDDAAYCPKCGAAAAGDQPEPAETRKVDAAPSRTSGRKWMYITIIAVVAIAAVVGVMAMAIFGGGGSDKTQTLPTVQATVKADITPPPDPTSSTTPVVDVPVTNVVSWTSDESPEMTLEWNSDKAAFTGTNTATGDTWEQAEWAEGTTEDGIPYVIHTWSESDIASFEIDGAVSGYWVFFVDSQTGGLYELCEIYDSSGAVVGGWEGNWTATN